MEYGSGVVRYTDHLETERLTTRFVTMDDVPVWTEYCRDTLATRFTLIPGKTPREMAEYVIGITIKRYEEGRLGLQALINKDTGEFVGQCGLLIQDDVDGKQELEIGYHLLRKHWGHGYATEAARMFRDYGFTNNFSDSMVSIIAPKNAPSKNVARRNGMQLVATNVTFRDGKYELFRITRQHWEKVYCKQK